MAKKRRTFRDRRGRFVKPDRRKIFRLEIDGTLTPFQRWTQDQLDAAFEIPLAARPLPPLSPGESTTVGFDIESASEIPMVTEMTPEFAAAVRIEVTAFDEDGEELSATFADTFDDPDELTGRLWSLLNELGAVKTDGVNELLQNGPITVSVEYFA